MDEFGPGITSVVAYPKDRRDRLSSSSSTLTLRWRGRVLSVAFRSNQNCKGLAAKAPSSI
jgi:hypothetical protein